MDNRNNKLVILIKIMCLSVALLSAIIMIGWITETDSLIRINKTSTPMQFNTALCFLLSIIGLLLISYRRITYIRKLAYIVGFISTFSLLGYVFNFAVFLDELFVDHYIDTDLITHPGRMAPNTAICFMLTSLSLFLYQYSSKTILEINRTLACVVLGIALVAIVGYLFGIPTAYGWSNLTGMALSTSVSFFIIALVTLLILSFKPTQHSSYTMPLLVFIIFSTAILWQAILAMHELNDYGTFSPNVILYAGAFSSLLMICFLSFKRLNSHLHFGQYITLVILFFGSISSISLYAYLIENQEIRVRDKLQNTADSHVSTIQAHVNILTAMSNNVRVIAYHNERNDEAKFNTLSALLFNEHPSITRLIYAPIVTNRDEFAKGLKQRKHTDLDIFDIKNNRHVVTPKRAMYIPVMYEYPQNTNNSYVGLNLYTHSNYHDGLYDSFKQDNLSHRIIERIVDGKALPLQGVVFTPITKRIYQKNNILNEREELQGFIILEYDFAKMINTIINQSLNAKGIHMLIEDKNIDHALIFHKSRLQSKDNLTIADLKKQKALMLPLIIADNELIVSVWPSEAFIARYETLTPEFISLILFFTSLIIAFYQYRTTLREQKIEQIKAYLSAIVDSLPSPLLVINEDFIFTDWNEEFASLFGFNKDAIQSQHIMTIMNQQPDFSRIRIEDEACMESGEPKRSDVNITLPNGDHKTYSYLRNVVQINNEKHLVGTLHDLTLEKKISTDLQDALSNSNDMFNSAPDAMVITNQQGIITQINLAAEKLFAYTADELLDEPIQRLIPSAINNEDISYRDSFIESQNSRFIDDGISLVGINKYAKEIPVELSLSQISTVDGVHVVTAIRDVSEQKAYENAINEAREQSERTNQSKSDFLANMSHEIRTPMNAIIGFSHLVLDSSLTHEQQKYINKIKTSANSLLGIINDILDFSKIEAHKLNLEAIPFNLYIDVIENIANIISLKAGEKQLELLFDFDTELPPHLMGDPLRVSQILLNLLNNAVKFTDKGEVSLAINVTKQNSEKVTLRFVVKDSGIGMTTKQVENLFMPFTQADTSTTRTYGGTGLGLSICSKLVDLMQGEIGVNSKPSEGSDFWFELEFPVIEQLESAAPVQLIGDKKLNVLIVDDNPSSLAIIKSYIESFGFLAEVDLSAHKALDRLERDEITFDLIITDWKMPDLDGIEFMRQIQQNEMSQAPAVIMVSAFDSDTVLAHSEGVELADIMTKPVTPSGLLESITNVLGVKQIMQQGNTRHNRQFDLSGIDILLAEDNETNQELAKELLNRVGANVSIAENGQQAIEHLNMQSFDIVLMDIQMPILDGISATKLLRENPEFNDLPIIAMTANALIGDREISLSAGMNDHIAKPIDVNELYSTVLKWVNNSEDSIVQGQQQVVNELHNRNLVNSRLLDALTLLGLKTNAALQRLDNDEELYLSLVQKFITRNSVEALSDTEATKESQLMQLTAQIHSLKGLLGNIGANALVEQCLLIESDLNNKQYPAHEVQVFIEEFQHLTGAIKELFAINKTQPKQSTLQEISTITAQEIEQYLDQLDELAFNNDTESIDILKQLISENVSHSDKFKQILSSCERYDFDHAMIQLSELRSTINEG